MTEGGQSSAGKEAVKIGQFVEILLRDATLLKKWGELSDCLDCPVHQKVRWERGVNTDTLTYYDLLSQILTSWTQRNTNASLQQFCQVLRRVHCQAIAQRLEEKFGTHQSIRISTGREIKEQEFYSIRPPSVEKKRVSKGEAKFVDLQMDRKWPLCFGLSPPAKSFVGREGELRQLAHFQSSENLVLISGLGGIGKTELCRKYAAELNYYKFLGVLTTPIPLWSPSSIIWLNGERAETLRDSLLHLATHLRVSTESTSVVEIFNYLVQFSLAHSAHLLVIIDNVDVRYEVVTQILLLTKSISRIQIIVTSRNRMVLEGAGHTILLDILDKPKAREMLHKSCGNLTNSDADKLCELVENYPLALQQAIAYIKQQRLDASTLDYSVADYIEQFERKKREMLGHSLNKFEHDYPMSTWVTWDVTFDKMSNAALALLNILAYLKPDAVEIPFVHGIYERLYGQSEDDFKESLNLIHLYSLIKVESGRVSMHRLVQERLRSQITEPEVPRKLLDAVLLFSTQKKDVSGSELSVSAVEQLNSLSTLIYQWEIGPCTKFASILQFLLKFHRIRCAVEYTQTVYPQLQFSPQLDENGKLCLLEKVLFWSIFNGELDVPQEVIESGDYAILHACDLHSLEIATSMAKRIFGPESELILRLEFKMVSTLYRDGQRERVLSICHQVLDSPLQSEYKKAFKKLIQLKNIGSDDSEGKRAELQSLLERKRERVGDSHPNTLKLMELLAKVEEEAEELQSALNLLQRVTHVYKSDGNVKEGQRLSSKVAELELRIGNFDHLSAQEIRAKFAHFQSYGKLSVEELDKVSSSFKGILGEGDEQFTLPLITAMAHKFESVGKLREVRDSLTFLEDESEYEVILSKDERMQRAGVELFYRKEYERARGVLESVLTHRQSHLGEGHWRTVETKKWLAYVLEKLGECERAIKLQKERLDYYKSRYGEHSAIFDDCKSRLGRLTHNCRTCSQSSPTPPSY